MQRSGGQAASLVIPSGINGDPNYNNAIYAYYKGNANLFLEVISRIVFEKLLLSHFFAIFR